MVGAIQDHDSLLHEGPIRAVVLPLCKSKDEAVICVDPGVGEQGHGTFFCFEEMPFFVKVRRCEDKANGL